MKKVVARANSNIALVKYWGKKDEEWFIPQNSSVSLTLDELYTVTGVEFNQNNCDQYILNGKLQSQKEHKKISEYIERYRKISGIYKYVNVSSENFVPTAAGLASSASGYAALALALSRLFGLSIDLKDVSKMARLGSGSASRSVYGGFVEWKKGDNHENSYAEKIDNADWGVAMIIAVVDSQKKEVSSREGMKKTVETSPYYESWVKNADEAVEKIKKYILERDFDKVGEITESSAMKMHATMLSANPPIIYFKPNSIKIIESVRDLRKEGISAYFTMDAGPNVKILCMEKDIDTIFSKLRKNFDGEIIVSKVGKDAEILEEIDD